ncbi:MAG: hypothetical protein BIFFINMI_01261 [Phycisphaerae bacterium]|nr:hypothetical protein [Phycisphaerae bacterium]
MLRLLVLAGALAALAAAAGCATPPDRLRLQLTVAETAGVDRAAEPVTFGVPLPEGKVADPQSLWLLDADGKALPASFTVAQRWLSGSIRWLHVHTLLSATGGRSRTLVLTDVPPSVGYNQPPAIPGDARGTPLNATVSGNEITIVTGPARVILSGDTPNVIESASYDPGGAFAPASQVLGGSPIGASVQADGKRYITVQPGSGRATILEQSSMRVVALVSGQFGGLAPDVPPSLSWEARVTAYAFSPVIQMDYTVINRTGAKAADKIDMEDLSLRLAVPLPRPQVLIGGARDVRRITLDNTASILQDSADHYGIRMNGRAIEEGPGKSVQPLTTGWMDLSAGGRGIAVGLRDFWQSWPHQIDARIDQTLGASLRVGLYPQESGGRQEIYIGQARTHHLTFRLHGAVSDPSVLAREMMAANRPLRVLCDPAWYCEGTKVYGPIASSGADYGRFRDVARHYDDVVGQSMASILRQAHEGRTDKDVTRDSYGWMDWGDTFFRKAVEGPMLPQPEKNLSWNGNYYDYGFAMLCQFMRTGDRRFLETGLLAGAYTADVFITHYFPEPALVGACHYCPPRYQAALDDGTPYVSHETNHAKVASVLARWQWLGDWWARQAAEEAFGNALMLPDADEAGWRQARGNGHRLRILWLAYQFTGQKKYQQRAAELIQLGVAHVQKHPEFDVQEDPARRARQRFMIGIALEGMIEQYWDQPTPENLQAIRSACDFAIEQKLKGYSVNMAMALGFCWQQTNDVRYLKKMNDLLLLTGPTDQAKIFGQGFRSTPWAMGYLHEAAAKGVKLPK